MTKVRQGIICTKRMTTVNKQQQEQVVHTEEN